MRCLLLVLVAACGAAVPPVPGKGGPAWLELTSDHFVVWTDAGEAHARAFVTEIEHLQQVVAGTAFPGATSPVKSFVIALRDDDEGSAYVPGDFSALASPPDGNLLKRPVIVLSSSSNFESTNRVETHELVHAISHALIRRQPRWFAEGMAKFYETIDLDAAHGTVDLGRAPESEHGAPIAMKHMIPLRQLFACTELRCTDASFYVTAWALFTYLTNTHAEQLATYEHVLAATGDSDRAWQEAFGTVSLDELDQDIRHWLFEGKHQVLHFNVQLVQPAIQVRTLGDADVYAVRAFMTFEFVGNHDRVRRDLAAARAIDPNNALAKTVADALGR